MDDRINDQMPHDDFYMDTFFNKANTVEAFVRNTLAEINSYNVADAAVRTQGPLRVPVIHKTC